MSILTTVTQKMFGYADMRFFCENGADKTAALADRLAHSVKFSDLRTAEGNLYVRVFLRDEEYVRGIAAALDMTSETLERRGVGELLRRYRKRIGFIIGAALAAVMIFFLSNTVMRIEITGTSKLPRDDILSMIFQSGVCYGDYIPDLDLRRAERRLLAMSDSFGEVSLRRSGFRIIAEITEGAPYPKMAPKNAPCSIISLYDAQVTSFNVYSGMLMVMKGDTVRKGEILVSGIVSKKFGGTYEVRSMAEVRGQYRRTAEFAVPFESTVYAEEKTFVNKYLTLFGNTFSLPGNKKLKGEFTSKCSTEYIDFLIFTLPAAVTTLEVTPCKETKVSYSEDEAKAVAEEHRQRFEEQLLNGNGTGIIDCQIGFDVTEEGVTLHAEYLLEGSIGAEKEIFSYKGAPSKISDDEEGKTKDQGD